MKTTGQIKETRQVFNIEMQPLVVSYPNVGQITCVAVLDGGSDWRRMGRSIELLKRAVNNRTRERNYFRLYSQLLENELSSEAFDKEIEENADEYVVVNNDIASEDDIKIALSLVEGIKDVDYVEDMADLFSFCNTHKFLEINGK